MSMRMNARIGANKLVNMDLNRTKAETRADTSLGLGLGLGVSLSLRLKEEVVQTARIDSRTLTRCHLCGFAEVLTDEVLDPEILFLAECPRCENRWTSRAPIVRPPPVRLVAGRFQRVPARVARVVAPAA